MTVTEIMEMIPSRYPIRYINYVDEITPDEKTIAIKNVTINEEFFQGRFPGNPTMPGVLIVEALTQAGSILVLKMGQFEDEATCIGDISRAKFRQKVVSGNVLKLRFEIVRLRDFVSISKMAVYVEDRRVCECEPTFIMGR